MFIGCSRIIVLELELNVMDGFSIKTGVYPDLIPECLIKTLSPTFPENMNSVSSNALSKILVKFLVPEGIVVSSMIVCSWK